MNLDDYQQLNALSVPELHSICDVHLVYLGDRMYGELKHHPLLTAPLPVQSPPRIPAIHSRKHKNHVPLDLRVSSMDRTDSVPVCNKNSNKDSCRIIQLFEKYSTHDEALNHMDPGNFKTKVHFEVKSLREISKLCIATQIPR